MSIALLIFKAFRLLGGKYSAVFRSFIIHFLHRLSLSLYARGNSRDGRKTQFSCSQEAISGYVRRGWEKRQNWPRATGGKQVLSLGTSKKMAYSPRPSRFRSVPQYVTIPMKMVCSNYHPGSIAYIRARWNKKDSMETIKSF